MSNNRCTPSLSDCLNLQKMLRVRDEEFPLMKEQDCSLPRERHLSDDYDEQELELYQQYRAAGYEDHNMVTAQIHCHASYCSQSFFQVAFHNENAFCSKQIMKLSS